MKRWLLLIMIVSIVALLGACSSSDPGTIEETLGKTPEVVYDNQFARDLTEGRWVGKLIVDFYEGAKDIVLTKNYVSINLDAEFIQVSNNLSELEMKGYMNFMYDTPIVTLYPEGIKKVEFTPNSNHYSGPYQAKISGVNGPEMYNTPAHINFLDIGKITGGVTVTIETDTNPTIIQSHYHDPGQGAFYANDLYTLRQMSFITLTPDGPDRAVFGAHSHLVPSMSGIEDTIYGYLEKVEVIKREEPIKYGEKLETSSKEVLRARIESRFIEIGLQIEPDTSLEYGKNDEEILELFRGKLTSRVKNLTKEQFLRIALPQAVIGVRGTDLYINVIDDDTALIRVYEGEIDVEVENETYTLSSNQGILILGRESKVDVFQFDSLEAPLRWIE